jgi:phage terminase small subunit
MSAKPKLTPEQWASTRATWEADPRDGYTWLVDELALPVSAPGVRKTALKDGWSKASALIPAVPKVNVSKVSMVSQKNHAKVSQAIKETMQETMSDVTPVEAAVLDRGNDFGLTPNQERFVQEYLIDLNATRAYLEAHPGAKTTTANTEGSRYLVNPKVAAAIKAALDARSERVGINAEEVLRVVEQVYFADARDLVEHWVGCCRYCWGTHNLLQRTDGELDHDREEHETKQDARPEGRPYRPFNEKGGGGFHAAKAPNPECPHCAGAGVGRTVVRDTRTISPQAALLYAGVKEGKDSIEVKVHDKMNAGDKLFRHLGLYEKDNSQKAAEFTTLEALQVFADRMEASRSRQRLMLEERRKLGFTGD